MSQITLLKHHCCTVLHYYVGDRFCIAYSYDLNVNRMANYQAGSHELPVGVLFPFPKYNISNPRYF